MKMQVEKNDTVDDFAKRYNLTVARLRSLNGTDLPHGDDDAIPANLELEVGGNAVLYESRVPISQSLLDKHKISINRLKELNDRIASSLQSCFDARSAMQKRITIAYLITENVAAAVVDPSPKVDDNPEFDWLIYETRVNAEDFQKEKLPLAYGLFAVPLDQQAEIVAAKDIPDALVKAFFPGLSTAELQDISAQSCRWRGGSAKPTGHGANSVTDQVAARSHAVIHIPRMMVMPYNYYANDTKSHSIGTNLEAEIRPGPAFRLKKFWPLWETASRSSVSVLTPTGDADLAESERLSDPWKYQSKAPPADAKMPDEYLNKPFKLGAYTNCFSVKTGVRWLGKVAQGSDDPGGGKDVLESNALLASMRSDWVEHVEKAIGRDPMLIVLRELLTVTFPNRYREKRDGYQIRDLSPLDTSKLYFPPLSIPFGGAAFVDAYNAKGTLPARDFTEFWKIAYAEAVGRAKAELLMRYGLQLTTPNPQNFLLEFDKATLAPTGRVVIRDIGDAKIHSEVIGQIGLNHPAIDYELNNKSRPGYLPAQTNNADRADDHALHARFDQYPLNTRTHWHQYSTFKDKYGGKFLPEKMMTTVVWGRAHYAAYVGHLSTSLNLPELKLPIFGREAHDRVLAATEVEPNKSKGEAAKRTLTAAAIKLATDAGGGPGTPGYDPVKVSKEFDLTKLTPDFYRTMISDSKCTIEDVINTEWALEVHTDEILHESFGKPGTLAKIKQRWNHV